MGEWRPDKMIHMDVGKYYKDDTHIYLWVIPSKVAGWWQWKLSLLGEDHVFDLDLSQVYQKIDGVVTNGDYNWQIFDATLSGEHIAFSLFGEAHERMIRQDYKGRVQGNSIAGTVELSGTFNETPLKWQATLKKPHFKVGR